MQNEERITSFQTDHRMLEPGMYVSRVDGAVVTYDLRTRKPNSGDFMDNVTMHSVEHIIATFLRNSEIKDRVLYFGPMGCQTGFYLLVQEEEDGEKRKDSIMQTLKTVKELFDKGAEYEGEMFGMSEIECGNYRTLSVDAARIECAKYSVVLANCDQDTLVYQDKSNAELCKILLK